MISPEWLSANLKFMNLRKGLRNINYSVRFSEFSCTQINSETVLQLLTKQDSTVTCIHEEQANTFCYKKEPANTDLLESSKISTTAYKITLLANLGTLLHNTYS